MTTTHDGATSLSYWREVEDHETGETISSLYVCWDHPDSTVLNFGYSEVMSDAR